MPARERFDPRTDQYTAPVVSPIAESSALARPREPGAAPVSFRAALRFWARLGCVSFGGPTGQIALMHLELVERRKWVSEERFLRALSCCMLLPGPEATQLATYIGWLLHGVRGGIAAGVLFVLPSVFLLLGLSWIYAAHGAVPWIAAIFLGLKPAVVAIVAQAVFRIGKRALRSGAMVALAAAAFVSLFFFELPFPLILLAAAGVGFLGEWLRPSSFASRDSGADASVLQDFAPRVASPWRRAAQVLATCLVLWWTPVALLCLWQGPDSVFVKEGLFFSKAALVTFGGAYAVLPYVAQAAVARYGWVTSGQMLDGLGLAETTPGPLIMVVQFVGFLGGWNHPGELAPWLAGSIGALITTWVTFVPCFLWIFLGAPYVERLRRAPRLSAALSCITAAVVGVVLNLAVWFARRTLFPTGALELGALDGFSAAVAAAAFVALTLLRWDVVPVVLGSGALGLAWHAFRG
jgi:chromate transporter